MMTDLQINILRFVAFVGDPTFANIQSNVGLEEAAVRSSVQNLVKGDFLRMKDDDQAHDWTYRITRLGRQILANQAL
jgi:DNA-binding IclR family transcriptional regulator